MSSPVPIPLPGRSDLAPQPYPRRSGFGATLGSRSAAVGLVTVALLLVTVGGTVAQTPPKASWAVLAIDQTNYTTEQSAFTVAVEVTDPGSVHAAYFTFCQLSSSVCYIPVTMTLHGSDWFEGTTNRMASYDGMVVGVRAGYNVTIEYDNLTNVTEPSLPNAFSGLTVATEVGGEFMYEMSVGNQLYGLTGEVTDAKTHDAVVGASVSLTPGNGTTSTTTASGAYSFSGLANGTYSVSVTAPGYPTGSTTVVVSGSSISRNIGLSSSGIVSQPPSHSNGFAFLTTTTGLVLVAGAALVVVAVAVLALTMMRKGKRGPPASSGPTSAEPDLATVAPPR